MEKRVVTDFRAQPHFERQRHRAHRIAGVQRLCGGPDLFPSERQGRHGGGAGDGHHARPRCARCRPGMFPANILKYDAASVPILQLGLSSKTLREQEIFDLGNNFIRTPLGTVQGASVSYPFGGKAARRDGGSEPGRALRQAALADRCLERAEPAEPDSAGGHGQAGAAPSIRSASTAARCSWTI